MALLIGQTLVNGLMVGLIYVLVALGLTLVWSILGMVNFAHGEFYMIGAFLTFTISARLGLPLPAALAASMAAVAVLGVAINTWLYRPVADHHEKSLVISLGVAILLQNVALIVWGPEDVGMPSAFSGVVDLAGLIVPADRLAVIVVALALVAAVYALVRLTRTGLAMRAVAQNREAALLQGMSVERSSAVAFATGSALAGAAGTIVGPIFSISPFIGSWAILKAFVAILLGGLGSLSGAVVGGLLLGQIESFVSTFVGTTASDLSSFVAVMLLLLFRPSGILGSRQ